MADIENHVGLENVDVMGQQSINNPAANDDAETEVNDDILRQALAEASGDNSFYHDNMSAHTNAQEGDSSSAVIYTHEGGDSANNQTQILVQAPDQAADAPLGSRANPIRIIQQGNQYTSMQQLTAEQIQQIMQVLQQQQIARSSAQAGGSTVVYNSDNNTRVVYRIIYPNELHKGSASAGSNGSSRPGASNGAAGAGGGGGAASSRRLHRKRRREGGWDEVSDGEWVAPDSAESEDSRQLGGSGGGGGGGGGGPELSKEEKEERKKHRPRTRSGRVSKPPKYMVKDYKHIHPLDWDEDYDDSDGGYSDFKQSDKDNDDGDSKDSMDASVYSDVHKKIWKCLSCYKSYIGPGGLGRHYRLNPDHGSLDEHAAAASASQGQEGLDGDLSQDSMTSKDASVQRQHLVLHTGSAAAAAASSSAASAAASVALDEAAGLVLAQRQQQQLSQGVHQLQGAANFMARRHDDYDLPPAAKKAKTPGYVPTGRPRGRPPSNPTELAARRRLRLRDLVKQCETDDLIDVVLPLIIPSVTCWEFLLMRSEEGSRCDGSAASPQANARRHASVADVLREFEELRHRVARAAGDCLRPASDRSAADGGSLLKINIDSEPLASALGLHTGTYDVEGGLRVQSSLVMQSAAASDAALLDTVAEAAVHEQLRPTSDGKMTPGGRAAAGQSMTTSTAAAQLARAQALASAAAHQGRSSSAASHSRTSTTTVAVPSTSDIIYTSVGVQQQQQQPSHHPLLQHGVNAHSLMPPAAVLQSAAAEQQQSNGLRQQRQQSLLAVQRQRQQQAEIDDHHAVRQQQHAEMSAGSLLDSGSGASDMSAAAAAAAAADESLMAALEGQVITLCGNQLVTADGSIVQLPEGASVVQTREGIVIYHPGAPGCTTAEGSDGATVAVQMDDGSAPVVMSEEGIPLETVQALLAVDSEGNATQIQYVSEEQEIVQQQQDGQS